MAIYVVSLMLFLFSATPAYAQLLDCNQTTVMGNPMMTQVPDLLAMAHEIVPEKSPFYSACQDPKSIVGRPSTGIFTRTVPTADSQGNQTVELLNKVAARVRLKIEANLQVAKEIGDCVRVKTIHSQCKPIHDWIQGDLSTYVSDARFHLALSQKSFSLDSMRDRGDRKINETLDPLDTYKKISWTPLDKNERQAAQAHLDRYLYQISQDKQEFMRKAEFKTSAEASAFENQEIQAVRFMHYWKYQDMMRQLPFVQFLSSSKPDLNEMKIAISRFENQVLVEQVHLNSWIKSLQHNPNPLSSKPLDLLQYRTILEEILNEEPRFCGLATSLVYTRENLQLGNALIYSLPLMAASFFVGPTAGLALGIASGADAVLESQLALKEIERRTLSNFTGNKNSDELQELRNAELSRNMSIVFMPAGSGLTAMGLSKVGQAMRVTKHSKALLESGSARFQAGSQEIQKLKMIVKD